MYKFKNQNETEKSNSRTFKEIRSFAITFILILVIALFIRNDVFARADVEGKSMQPTLHGNDVLFVEKICLFTHNFKRGEIIIFDSKQHNHDIFVKRIIGLEGDTIEIKNGTVYRNGAELEEDYLAPGITTHGDIFLNEGKEYTVPKGFIFVMGDNRGDSEDSRYLGPINIKDIKGHVVIRAYPFNQINTFK